jgi:hypothetical protein
MSYREYAEPPRRRTSRALVRLTMLVWLLVFSCAGLRAFAIPAVNDFVSQRVLRAINPNVPLPSVPNLDPVEQVQEQINQLPLLNVPPISAGPITISDDVATAYLAGQTDTLGVNDVAVQFVPNEIVATITVPAPLVGEVEGTVRANARAENGRIVLDNERIEGPIGSIISPVTLIDGLENRLNNEIAQQGRRVASVEVREGEATIVFE